MGHVFMCPNIMTYPRMGIRLYGNRIRIVSRTIIINIQTQKDFPKLPPIHASTVLRYLVPFVDELVLFVHNAN